MNKQKSKAHKGLTMVEVILVVTIMGILALVIIPNISEIIVQNQIATFEQNCKLIGQAIEMYKNDHSGGFPTSAEDFDAYIAGGLGSLNDSPKGAAYQMTTGVLEGEPGDPYYKVVCTFRDIRDTEHIKEYALSR